MEKGGHDGWLWIVADGVGAYGTGEEASRTAGQAVLRTYAEAGQADPVDRLRYAVEAGNRVVWERRRSYVQQGRPQPVLTTLLAALLVGDRAILANVGDCRAYLIRAGRIAQLTRDHTWVAEQVAAGLLSPAAASEHPRRHVVTRAVGQRETVEVDLFVAPLVAGDRLVLCSDGLTVHLADPEILQLGGSGPPDAAARAMVDLANARGGEDNITVGVVEVVQAGAVRTQPSIISSATAEHERIGAVFSPHPPRSVAGSQSAMLDAICREVTIICMGAGDLTESIAERHAPEDVVSILNECLTGAAEVIFEAGGTLAPFLGDGLVAFFNAPMLREDHVLAAARAATRMQARLSELQAPSGQRIGFSIGIHTGQGILGMIGTPERMAYTVVGEVVNVAARLQNAAGTGEVLLTGTAYARIADALEVEDLGRTSLAHAGSLQIYRLKRVFD